MMKKQRIIFLIGIIFCTVFWSSSCDKDASDDWKTLKNCPEQPYVDYMGKRYETVKIGEQCWMAQNLDVGTQISTGTEPDENNSTIEKYCYDDNPGNCYIYGGLYTWDEMLQFNQQTQKHDICPVGWHIPNISDWKELTYNLSSGLSDELKEAGGDHWQSNSGTNKTGFTALPGGYLDSYGRSNNITTQALFWIKDEKKHFLIEYRHYDIPKSPASLNDSYSIRCIKSNQPPSVELITEDSINYFPLEGTLYWLANDMDLDKTFCNVYLGTDSTNLALIDTNNIENSIDLSGIIQPGKIYFWQIEAFDGEFETLSPKRVFVTERPACDGYDELYYEGKTYHTVQIGNQCWMRESLDVGTMINSSNQPSDNGIIEKYCLDNNPENCEKFGALYNWQEMLKYTYVEGSQGICPPGWHIPTNEDWNILVSNFDGNVGGKLKMLGTEFWKSPNTNATNESGMGFLPNSTNNESVLIFSSSVAFLGQDPYRYFYNKLYYDGSYFSRFNPSFFPPTFNCTVRCIKNN